MKVLTLFLAMLMVTLGWQVPAAQAQTCAAPTNITVTPLSSGTNSGAVVSFTPSPSAVSYTVRYYAVGDSIGTTAQTTTVTSSPVTLSGLQYHAYYVTVTSNCAGTATGGSTASSAPVILQLPWASCGTPTNVQVSTTGATGTSGAAATATFGGVSGAINYTVQCLLAGTNIVIINQTIIGTTATLTGLLPNTAYIVRVVANCPGGMVSPAIGTGFTTPALSSGCGNVTNLTVTANSGVTATGSTSAVVNFTAVSGATSYTLLYYAVGDSINAQTLTVGGGPVTLSGLLANTNYVVRVLTNCAGGATSTGVVRVVHTSSIPAPCGPVTNITLTATSATTATITFTPGAGNTSFHITYYILNDSTRWVNTTSSPATLSGLIPGQTYYVQVTSVCGTGASSVYTAGGQITFSFRGTLAARNALGTGTLSVFPNPAHHVASLTVPAVTGVAQAHVTLLNALGQQVRTLTVPLASAAETHAQIDLSGVAAGLYTLRVVAGEQSASQRLVVE